MPQVAKCIVEYVDWLYYAIDITHLAAKTPHACTIQLVLFLLYLMSEVWTSYLNEELKIYCINYLPQGHVKLWSLS